jgi:hypothetical protein
MLTRSSNGSLHAEVLCEAAAKYPVRCAAAECTRPPLLQHSAGYAFSCRVLQEALQRKLTPDLVSLLLNCCIQSYSQPIKWILQFYLKQLLLDFVGCYVVLSCNCLLQLLLQCLF